MQSLSKKYCMGYFKFECFPWAMIELIHYGLNLVIDYALKDDIYWTLLIMNLIVSHIKFKFINTVLTNSRRGS